MPDSSVTPQPDAEVHPPTVPLRTIAVVAWGTVLWAVALVIVLLVPDLHSGNRSWWPWVPVAGIGLGALAYVYLRRGRGNAAEA